MHSMFCFSWQTSLSYTFTFVQFIRRQSAWIVNTTHLARNRVHCIFSQSFAKLIRTCNFDRIPPFSRSIRFLFRPFLRVFFPPFCELKCAHARTHLYVHRHTSYFRLLVAITASGFERLHSHHRKINSYKISLPRRFKAPHPRTFLADCWYYPPLYRIRS